MKHFTSLTAELMQRTLNVAQASRRRGCGRRDACATLFGERPPLLSFLLMAFALGLSGCATQTVAESKADAWSVWQTKRHESIAGTNGWATLVGLLWLHEGTNTLGSDPASELRLPAGRAPRRVGTVIRAGHSARFVAATAIEAAVDGKPTAETALQSDAEGAEPTVLTLGALRIIVLQRGERLGLRVKDPKAPTRLHFLGLDYFPHDPKWRIAGRFVPAAPPRKLRISDVTGAVNEEVSPGTLVFTVNGREHRLDALDDDETHDLFVIFRDRTAGKTTYGAGRFLHVDKPGADGRVVIDFNYAYNPPCAFTPFATCPIPPKQNWLPIPVAAGEKKYRGGHE